MIKALVDPSLLTPPADGSCTAWLRLLRLWSQLLREVDDAAIHPILSFEAQAGLAALAGRDAIQAALTRSGSELGASDVISLIESIRARTSTPEEVFEPADIVFRRLELDPDYVDSGAADLVQSFRHDVGHGAVFQQEGDIHLAAITTSPAWKGAANRTHIAADVEAWERSGVVEEPSDDAATVSEAIDLWLTPRGADMTLAKCRVRLIEHPRLGIQLAYRESTPEAEEIVHPLNFEVGPQLAATMEGMGYGGKTGRIKAVFKAAAYIGSQRGGELRSLEPHPYRTSASPTAPAVERADGARLMRGSLGTGPNAARLMWWDGPVPELLGVVGHNDNPLFLT